MFTALNGAQAPIAIVGAGRVAQALGRLLYVHGEPLVALAGRNGSSAERAATFIGPSVRAVAYSDLPALATRVLIAVSDAGILPVAEAIAAAGMSAGVALHTCGAKGPDALAPLGANGVACGMMHPLQTVMTPEQGVKSLEGITFGVAGDQPALDWAERIVALLDGRVLRIAAERLPYYHAGAVMASNALIGVIDAAVSLLVQAGVEEHTALRAVGPLSRTSLDNALSSGPRAALTGPIARGDAATVAAHMDALVGAPPTVAALYLAAARHLLELAKQRGLREADVRALEVMLEGGKVV